MPVSSQNTLAFAAIAALGLAACHPAAAQGLVGTPVTGSLTFAGSSQNAFSNNTAVISASQTEFGFADFLNKTNSFITADFTSDQLVLTRKASSDTGSGGSAAAYTFTDPAFGSVTKTSDTFIGGLTYSFVGNTLTINQPAFGFDGTYTAAFHIVNAAAPVPEASSTVSLGLLLALGLGGLTLARRKKLIGAA